MTKTWTLALAIMFVATGAARAEQFWIAYEGNDYPETEGWHRITQGGGAVRTLVDGSLELDSSASTFIEDFYVIERPVTLEAGEVFIAEWRTRVDFDSNKFYADSGVVFISSTMALAGVRMDYDSVFGTLDSWSVPVEPAVFHTFRFVSSDFLSYTLTIDDGVQITGSWFQENLLSPRGSFGDGVEGVSSLARWDYVRWGVVPEPDALYGLAFAMLLARRRHPGFSNVVNEMRYAQNSSRGRVDLVLVN